MTRIKIIFKPDERNSNQFLRHRAYQFHFPSCIVYLQVFQLFDPLSTIVCLNFCSLLDVYFFYHFMSCIYVCISLFDPLSTIVCLNFCSLLDVYFFYHFMSCIYVCIRRYLPNYILRSKSTYSGSLSCILRRVYGHHHTAHRADQDKPHIEL